MRRSGWVVVQRFIVSLSLEADERYNNHDDQDYVEQGNQVEQRFRCWTHSRRIRAAYRARHDWNQRYADYGDDECGQQRVYVVFAARVACELDKLVCFHLVALWSAFTTGSGRGFFFKGMSMRVWVVPTVRESSKVFFFALYFVYHENRTPPGFPRLY